MTKNTTITRTIRILPVHGRPGAYDIRRVDGSILVHIGDVHRDGAQWVARKRGAEIATGHRTRRDAVAQLSA